MVAGGAHSPLPVALPLARWNHPPWWIERLQADWPRQWQEVLAFDNTRPPLVPFTYTG